MLFAAITRLMSSLSPGLFLGEVLSDLVIYRLYSIIGGSLSSHSPASFAFTDPWPGIRIQDQSMFA